MSKHAKSDHPSKDTQQSMQENDEHLKAKRESQAGVDAIPAADLGGHARSHAAHPHGGAEDTKPAGNLRQGSSPGARREPPQGQGRT